MHIIFFLLKNNKKYSLLKKKRIGVISLENSNNIGNNLVKFAMFIKLKELNFDPIIIALTIYKNIYFVKNQMKLIEINKSYDELNETDFDYLIVNSDQTWSNYNPKYFLDYGFLKFSENWNIPKLVYGASYPFDKWLYSKTLTQKMTLLLKKMKAISVRELPTINFAKKYLNATTEFVLDPTLLIDKKYYLDLIKNYNGNFDSNKSYLCVYQLDKNKNIRKFIYKSASKLKLSIYNVNLENENYIEDFLKCINISKAVITDSYHGTVFSILFEKPFISFINKGRGNTRFYTLRYIFNAKNRIISKNVNTKNKIKYLKHQHKINKDIFEKLKNRSLLFLKKHLQI